MKSGYKIIDFGDINLVSGTPSTIAGIHKQIENTYRKPYLFCGLTIAGVEKPAIFPEVSVASSKYTATIYGGTIEIDADDNVTFTSVG